MRVRAESATGDYTFGQSQGNFLVNSAAAVAQLIDTALGLLQGEWFLDNTAGTPYGTQILGFGTGGLYDAAVQGRILGVQGVSQITDYESNLNGATRVLSISCTAQTSFGPVPVTASLGLPATVPIPLNFEGEADPSAEMITFTWSPVPGTTYNLYRGTVPGSLVPMPIGTNLTGGTVTIPAAVGVTFYYALTAVVNNVESQYTPEIEITPIIGDLLLASGGNFLLMSGGNLQLTN